MHQQIITEIQRIKEKYPDWRFGQIVANALAKVPRRDNDDPYYYSDESLLEGVKKL